MAKERPSYGAKGRDGCKEAWCVSMANERMYLLHEPSGFYVPLGKRMGWGWYGVPVDIGFHIRSLYELVECQEAEGDQDAFVVAFEGDDRLRVSVPSHIDGEHMSVFCDAELNDLTSLAHEIWAVAQLMPNEGIEDGVDRIVNVLRFK